MLYHWKDESGVYKDATKGSNCTLVNYDTDPDTLSDMLCFNDDEKASDPLFKAGKGFDFPTGLGELQGKAFMSKVRALLGESAGAFGKN